MESQEVHRRLAKLEDADDKMKDALQQLIVSTTTMQNTLERLDNLAPVVRKLEMDVANNKIVLSAVKWLALTVGGSALSMAIGLLVKGGFFL